MARNAENQARLERERAAGLVATLVRLPEEVWEEAKHLAIARRTSLNTEIREALRKHLEEARRESQSRQNYGREVADIVHGNDGREYMF